MGSISAKRRRVDALERETSDHAKRRSAGLKALERLYAKPENTRVAMDEEVDRLEREQETVVRSLIATTGSPPRTALAAGMAGDLHTGAERPNEQSRVVIVV